MNWIIRPSSGQPVIQYDRYDLSFREWLLYVGTGTAFCGLIVYTFYRDVRIYILSLPFAFVYPLYKRKDLMKKRLSQLNLQFKEAILILSSSLSAGYSVENAFINSHKELQAFYGDQAFITREFAYMSHQLGMNRTVEQVLEEFADRSGLDDVKNFANVFSSAKRSGGELVFVIAYTVSIIQDKVMVQEDILTLTSAKRLEQRVMNAIPFFIIFYIDSTSPGFFNLMYTTALGKILMTACLAVYALAYLISERVLDIDV